MKMHFSRGKKNIFLCEKWALSGIRQRSVMIEKWNCWRYNSKFIFELFVVVVVGATINDPSGSLSSVCESDIDPNLFWIFEENLSGRKSDASEKHHLNEVCSADWSSSSNVWLMSADIKKLLDEPFKQCYYYYYRNNIPSLASLNSLLFWVSSRTIQVLSIASAENKWVLVYYLFIINYQINR